MKIIFSKNICTNTRLGFEVRICSNLSVKDITKTLEKAAMEDHTNNDMFAGDTAQ